MRKEVVIANLKYSAKSCVENTRDLRDYSRFPGRDLKLRPLKCEGGAVPVDRMTS